MTITEYKNHFFQNLTGLYPQEEVGSFFQILTVEYLGLSRLDIALDREKVLSQEDILKLNQGVSRLMDFEPIQYITGKTEFYGLIFKVDRNVLIPRPETEELVEWVVEDNRDQKEIHILDIGTGSGCIGISLAKNLPNSHVTAVDISKEALRVAGNNASLNQVNMELLEHDIFSPVIWEKKFDIIVSNPPYVRELEKKEMQRNVLDFEPRSALYVSDEDPLVFYKRIAAVASESLNQGGKLYFEINQYLGEQTERLLKQKNFNTIIKNDIFGEQRMLRATK